MPTYAIGDIQGCFDSLEALLGRFRFDSRADRLWLVGDLVNRGPRSLDVLRWARGLGDRAVTVLGNHDLHLLGVAAGVRPLRPRDTFAEVLAATDAADLLAWLARRPLLHREGSVLMVHAGLLPVWTWDQAERLAREAEGRLSVEPALFQKRLSPGAAPELRRVAETVAALTRARCLTRDGALVEEYTGGWRDRPAGTFPWFDHPDRLLGEGTVIFGHWASLGLVVRPDIIALDSACVWGGDLSAVRLEDRAVFVQPSLEELPPDRG